MESHSNLLFKPYGVEAEGLGCCYYIFSHFKYILASGCFKCVFMVFLSFGIARTVLEGSACINSYLLHIFYTFLHSFHCFKKKRQMLLILFCFVKGIKYEEIPPRTNHILPYRINKECKCNWSALLYLFRLSAVFVFLIIWIEFFLVMQYNNYPGT